MSLSKAIGVISGINEFGNLFQLVRSAVSHLLSQRSGTHEQHLREDDLLQLQSDLRCLSETLPSMYSLIDRAEWRSHVPCVAQLLPKLKDAVYDVEDILDEFRWYELKLAIEGMATQMSPFTDFFQSVTQGNFSKVTDIQRRVNNLSRQLEKMDLHQATPRFDKSVRPETTSFPTEQNLFGRDKEMNELIRLLGVHRNGSIAPSKRKRTGSGIVVSAENYNEVAMACVPVLPIVGIGGVGKTSLVQRLCEHKQVTSHFDKNIIWICVSDDFDVKRITKELIQILSSREATTDNLDSLQHTDNLDSLQHTLATSMNQKKFLLILDDMWEDVLKESGGCWNRFCAPFMNAIQGSMMLVTTRSQKVADQVGTMVPFQLEGLKDHVFWEFFKLYVFGYDNSNNYPELERIGKQMLPKLRGSPLAAKTIGRLLQMNLDTTHWNSIHKSELWELRQEEADILPALRLSYIYLPFHLKRCFSFCALFPKDYIFEKHRISEIWVAEGLVEPQGDIPILEIGCQYFEDLASRSFFQMVHRYYVMHDLMHDMAQLVSKDECFTIKNESDFLKVPRSVRHLSILSSINSDNPKLLSLCKYKKLRTLIYDGTVSDKTSASPMDCWCSELQYIRLFSCASMRELPESISNMKHLRYLHISKACPFKSLPSGFYCLYNLQVMYARNCEFKSFCNEFVKRLTKLRRFITRRLQYHHGVASSLSLMGYPGESFDFWIQPQKMQDFLTSDETGGSIRLKSMPVSRSSQCQSLNVIPTVLVEKNNDNTDSIFSSLTNITIEGCISLTSLEQFLQPAYLPAVKKIKIANCKSSRGLQVPSLKKLELKESGNLGEDIECCSLNYLHLSYSSLTSINLQLWSLPALKTLSITKCQYLAYIGESTTRDSSSSIRSIKSFSSLTDLIISRCDNLVTFDDILTHDYVPVIERIQVDNCYNELRSLPGERFGTFSTLKALHIRSCPLLSWQSGMALPSSLRLLFIEFCGDLSAWFPSCLENLTSLESLQMVSCERIVSIPGHSNLRSLRYLWIENCPHLVSVGGPEAIENKTMVYISGCPMLKELHQPVCRWQK
ncbi:putative disease resistance protein RGA4 isoform X2 [Panicum hallii]|uniref:putative disease resistance protein RGA4 isoform X2 n=1 Tax=Panicum hallii TaxID=206008 RepID=UPI000DF4E1E6|nr:putative disease resistance protein RGA4 isoform X2 [Panicum hallii]